VAEFQIGPGLTQMAIILYASSPVGQPIMLNYAGNGGQLQALINNITYTPSTMTTFDLAGYDFARMQY
jgi:hypothetical protein